MQELYIGLMSGTSIDGIDAVLCTFNQGKSEILESTSVDYDKDTKALLHSLCQSSYDEIEKMGVAKVKLATFEPQAVNELLLKAKVEKEDIVAIGSHGQTIRHRPEKSFSIQLDDGALLAALTGIDVICDFRSADIAHGGNGAPLTQAFHKMQFQDPTKVSFVLNLGGIANLTVIDCQGKILQAYDVGPANTLLDTVCRMIFNKNYDKDGELSKKGQVNSKLLSDYMSCDYLQLPPPKSTGRETFNADFIKEELLIATTHPEFAYDLMATLAEFTALSCVNAVRGAIFKFKIDKSRLIVCGGGAYNSVIMSKLSEALAKNNVETYIADDLGVNSKLIEAHAFAYFAYKFVKRETLDLACSTNARENSILGCLYPKTPSLKA